MSSTKRGLGRGLDALFGNNNAPQESIVSGNINSTQVNSTHIDSVHIDLLVTNPNQPRKYFNDDALIELAESISSQGIIQPILVRPLPDGEKYEIIAGERRYKAAQLANLQNIPVYIRDMTDIEVMAASLIENIQREDLNPIEQSLALKRLRDEFLITQDDLSKKIGKSRSAVANSLRLLKLSAQAQEALIAGKINVGHARAILSIDVGKIQEILLLAIIDRGLTVRDAENAVKDWKNKVPFFWEEEAVIDINSEAVEKNEVEPEEVNTLEEQVAPVKVSSNRIKPESIKNLQKQLNDNLRFRANISGTEEKGRITLSYQNAAEFETLLQQLGIQK